MVKTLKSFLFLGLCFVAMVVLDGCKQENQLPPPPQGQSKSALTELRDWLTQVANSGELDSFVEEGLPQAIESLKSSGSVKNTDELSKLADELAKAKNKADIKAKAKAMLNLLPKQ